MRDWTGVAVGTSGANQISPNYYQRGRGGYRDYIDPGLRGGLNMQRNQGMGPNVSGMGTNNIEMGARTMGG